MVFIPLLLPLPAHTHTYTHTNHSIMVLCSCSDCSEFDMLRQEQERMKENRKQTDNDSQ